MKSIFAAIFLLISLEVIAFDQCPDIKVCWEPYEPFQMKVGNKMTGFDFDILEAIAKKMSCKVTYHEVPWQRCLAGIESGEFDVTGSAVKTPERDVFARFSDAYMESANVFFALKKDFPKLKMKTMSDILEEKDFILGVTRGYDYGAEFQELMKNKKFAAMTEESNTEESNFQKLAAGRISGFYADEFVGMSNLKRLKLTKIIGIHHRQKASPGFFMFSKKTRTEEFVQEFNKDLKQIRKDGIYKKIISKYLR